MALTLAIDCAMRQISIAVGEGGVPIFSLVLRSGAKQASVLPGIVRSSLESAGAEMRDIALIASTVGPGYYTGIRAGLSYASALAFASGVSLAPISTLDALALGLSPDVSCMAAIRAKRDHIYAASYRGGELCRAAAFISAREAREDRPALIVGCGDETRDALGALPEGTDLIDGSALVPVGMLRATLRAQPMDPTEVRAVYLRDPD